MRDERTHIPDEIALLNARTRALLAEAVLAAARPARVEIVIEHAPLLDEAAADAMIARLNARAAQPDLT